MFAFPELDSRVHHQRHLLHLAQERQQGRAGAKERRAAVFPLRLGGGCRVRHLMAARIRVKFCSRAAADRYVSCLSILVVTHILRLYVVSVELLIRLAGVALVFISFAVDREVLTA